MRSRKVLRGFFFISVLAGLGFVSCGKDTAKADSSVEKPAVETSVPGSAPVPADTVAVSAPRTDPEIEKLGRVLASLSPRAKAAIPDGNSEEFLADLHRVLEAETSFRKDDLSLYYLIDKKHNVGEDYVPKDLVTLEQNELFTVNRKDLSLRPDVLEGLKELSRAALQDGIKLLVSSTYRSYSYQKWLFQHWVDVDGLEEAERESARAGTSQHQLGVAIDFGSITDDFAETRMGRWLAENCEDYGWSLSFPKGYEDVTGFRWECWHFRYIGKPACEFQKKWFGDVQQFMLEFIDAWKNDTAPTYSPA